MDVSASQQQHLQPSGVVLQQLHSPSKVELDVGRRCNLRRNDLQPARHVSIAGSMSLDAISHKSIARNHKRDVTGKTHMLLTYALGKLAAITGMRSTGTDS